jgi:hypothetical protein
LPLGVAAEHIQQLESQLYQLLAAEEQRCLEAKAATSLEMEQACSSSSNDVSSCSVVRGETLQSSVAAQQQRSKPVKGSLFEGSSLQLVPPTPMLQQLVLQHKSAAQKQQQQQQQVFMDNTCLLMESASASTDAAAAAATISGPDALAVAVASVNTGLDIPASRSQAGGVSYEATSSHSLIVGPPSLLPGNNGGDIGGEEASDAAAESPGRSSVSSAAMPAAALLMAPDIIDLDLTLDDDQDTLDDHQPDGQDHTTRIFEGTHSHLEQQSADDLGAEHALKHSKATTASLGPAAAAAVAAGTLLETERRAAGKPVEIVTVTSSSRDGTVVAVDSPVLAIPAELLIPSSHISSVCLSSPRPRRLTFAAVADCSSPGSPPGSSRSCQKEEVGDAARNKQWPADDNRIQNLRQRFADLQQPK